MGDQYRGMRSALKMAMATGQPVNVGLNRAGQAVKIEGVIEAVHDDSFRIKLEQDDAAPGRYETVPLTEVEYTEYS